MNKKQTELLNDYILHTALHLITLEERQLKKECAGDLSLRELHVLEAVAALEDLKKNTMAEIARYLSLSPASVTTSVNVLVKKKYLSREYSASDRRVIYVELTDSGREANRKYLDFVRRFAEHIGRELDEASADAMIAALIQAHEYLSRE